MSRTITFEPDARCSPDGYTFTLDRDGDLLFQLSDCPRMGPDPLVARENIPALIAWLNGEVIQ